jgi:hypothetical protein
LPSCSRDRTNVLQDLDVDLDGPRALGVHTAGGDEPGPRSRSWSSRSTATTGVPTGCHLDRNRARRSGR